MKEKNVTKIVTVICLAVTLISVANGLQPSQNQFVTEKAVTVTKVRLH